MTATTTEPTYDAWMDLSRTEYDRTLALLDDLAPEDWLLDTDCAGWRVREIVAHLVGAGEGNASLREMVRQARLGRRAAAGRDLVDGMTDVQVRERQGLTPQQLRDALADVAPRAVAGRSRYPAAVRRIAMPWGPPLGVKPLGYLMGRIYTRDLWMHRVDLARATGRDLVLTADHDGVIVADVVHEWAARHGRPYRLELTGPAGGEFASTDARDVEPEVLDAVELMRGLSGRAPDAHLLATSVPF